MGRAISAAHGALYCPRQSGFEPVAGEKEARQGRALGRSIGRARLHGERRLLLADDGGAHHDGGCGEGQRFAQVACDGLDDRLIGARRELGGAARDDRDVGRDPPRDPGAVEDPVRGPSDKTSERQISGLEHSPVVPEIHRHDGHGFHRGAQKSS